MTRRQTWLPGALVLVLGLIGNAGAAPQPETPPEMGAAVYHSKCLLCHPNSPGKADGPRYKARPDAVPLWTLFDNGEGWRESQVGLGQWSDKKMNRWLRFPKGMKPETNMIEVPMEPQERRAVIRYIKYLGRQY